EPAQGMTPNVDRLIQTIDLPGDDAFLPMEDRFIVTVEGYLLIDRAGDYEFRLTSDDGSLLSIDGETVIWNKGLHAPIAMTGRARIDAGLTPLRILMFENTGGAYLRLEWKVPGADAFEIVPAALLRTEKGVTRVVSPGVKKLDAEVAGFRPGDRIPLESVHPGWKLSTIHPDDFDPMVGCMELLPDGRLIIGMFEPKNNGVELTAPNGDLWALSNLDADDPNDIVVEKFAEGFYHPLGLKYVDGALYVAQRDEITKMTDRDGDGSFETRERFASGWTSDNYHHFTFGLIEHDGWLYGALSTAIYFDNTMAADHVRGTVVSMNGPNPPHRGTCFRVNLATRAIEYLCGGLRTPNGVGVGSDGEIFVTDNQGAWLPSSKLIHMVPGRFYGYRTDTRAISDRYPDGGAPSLFSSRPVTPPAVWLPQNEICNSPTQPLLIREGEFAGQMYLAELTMGGIRRVFLEQVLGEYQGAVFRFSQGFESGINRMIEGPDGSLYVGGTGAAGNWSWRGTRTGLQRIRPTTGSAFEYHSVLATPDGFEVRLTRPVDRAWLEDTANYRVVQWRYHPTPEYGGPKQDQARLVVTRAVASGDRRSVHLAIPGLREESVVYLRMDPVSDMGEKMWSTEAWYTLNRIPPRLESAPDEIRPLDRDDLRAFMEPRGDWVIAGAAGLSPQDSRALAWDVGRGVILNGPNGLTTDLVSVFDHGDVEAHIEFMVPDNATSGVWFMGRYEVQIRDSWGVRRPGPDDCGGIPPRAPLPEGANEPHFDGAPPRVNAARPAGEWQTYDVLFRAPRFDDLDNKIENAHFVRVVHNGMIIHENVELPAMTEGSLFEDEAPYGPLRIEGSTGAVAFRNIRLRPLPPR
ncbi:MAG: DUF1080 domain-containing protein, partial [Phycisphaerales bacterium]|nr:DUF1080 domain-containing protein [Phycisphaerales bacterium]